MSEITTLTSLEAGTPILFGGNKLLKVPAELAERFRAGDSVVVVEASEELLLIPADERAVAEAAVSRAHDAFGALAAASDDQISQFYREFAARLEDDGLWSQIQKVNDEDVADAAARGRSTTRLVAGDKLRRDMIDGLRGWIDATSRRGQVLERIEHADWEAQLVGAALGVVGFVFEGRPNVLADATGVLRGGNCVVFRIGRDALRSARAIMELALQPALQAAGLPEGAVSLVDSSAHAAGWALFGDRRLSLAVARGSGPAVATLGALAQQAGVPVSLHGTGGAWIVAGASARDGAFADAVLRSLDRKVCNTLNTCCIVRERADDLVPVLLESLQRAGDQLGQTYKLHVVEADRDAVPGELYTRSVSVRRAEGDVQEMQAELADEATLGHEWEWEQTPEITLKIVDDVAQAVALFNRYSPQFVACMISDDAEEAERFYQTVNAPFVGDGHTRWVDGQVALGRPELGLSNWQWGRLFGRGGVLSGDTVYTVRTRALGTSR
jgi:glutamate-5-semialdehyde dehydrogenase